MATKVSLFVPVKLSKISPIDQWRWLLYSKYTKWLQLQRPYKSLNLHSVVFDNLYLISRLPVTLESKGQSFNQSCTLTSQTEASKVISFH